MTPVPPDALADISDSSIIDAAWSGGAGPIMVVTNIKEGGNFDSGLASWLLTRMKRPATV